jgi:hypothetical protein
VPQRVVDLLEAVQVDEQQGGLDGGSRSHGQALLQAVAEQHPVGQLGERVVRGLVTVAVG